MKILKILALVIVFFGCSKDGSSVKNVEDLINEIEKIEKNEMNTAGVEFDYYRNDNYQAVDFTAKTKESSFDWSNSEKGIAPIVKYIERSNELVKNFSHLQSDNKKVAEIILKNQFLKQEEEFFRGKLSALRENSSGKETTEKECPKKYRSDSRKIQTSLNNIQFESEDGSAILDFIEYAKLMDLSELCHSFHSKYGKEGFTCIERTHNSVHIDAGLIGWRLCEEVDAHLNGNDEKEKIMVREREKLAPVSLLNTLAPEKVKRPVRELPKIKIVTKLEREVEKQLQSNSDSKKALAKAGKVYGQALFSDLLKNVSPEEASKAQGDSVKFKLVKVAESYEVQGLWYYDKASKVRSCPGAKLIYVGNHFKELPEDFLIRAFEEVNSDN